MSRDNDSPDPIKHAPLKNYSKQLTPELWEGEEMWASDESIEELEDSLLEVARAVWKDAAQRALEDERRTVRPGDVNEAYEEFKHPHKLLQQAANDMEKLRWRFLDTAAESPLITQDE
jgi:histone H3/H4